MLKGAMRLHPDLRAVADKLIASMVGEGGKEYMTLHARVEPDMQFHPVWYVGPRDKALEQAVCERLQINVVPCCILCN